MKLYTLGCNGWIPTKNQTCCFMIEAKDSLILLDAGSGVANLVSHEDVINRYEKISIILSHYHLDHIIGLSYLLPFIKDKEVIIYGPGRPIYPLSTEEYIQQLLQPSFFSANLRDVAKAVRYEDYKGEDFQIDSIEVKVRLQSHSSPSFRIRIENNLIYATDTILNPKDWTDIQGSPLLLHECWSIKSDVNVAQQHTSLDSIISDLHPQMFNRVLLIHQNPLWKSEDRDYICKVISNTNIELAEDNVTYVI